jgi:hypothetical protein
MILLFVNPDNFKSFPERPGKYRMGFLLMLNDTTALILKICVKN